MALVVAALAALVAGGAAFLAFQALRGVQRAAATAAGLLAAYQLAESRADAERVCAWAVSERETFEKIITRGVVGAAVRNAGQTPVYDLEIVFRDPPAAWTAIRRVRIVPPSEQPEVYAGIRRGEHRRAGRAGPDQRGRHDPARPVRPTCTSSCASPTAAGAAGSATTRASSPRSASDVARAPAPVEQA